MVLSIARPAPAKRKKPTAVAPQTTMTLTKPPPSQPAQPKPPSAPREVAPAVANAAATTAAVPKSPVIGTQTTIQQPGQTAPAMTTFSNVPPAPAPVGEGVAETPSGSGVSQGGAAKLPGAGAGGSGFLDRIRGTQAGVILNQGEKPTPTTENTNLPPPPPPPSPEAPAGPSSNEEFNAQIRAMLEKLVGGEGMKVNTAEEEALIKELMQDRLGQGLVEQRARMGRAGFGASGALAAMEGDVRRQAGQQATQETLALRRQAEQDAIANAMKAVGVDIDVRKQAGQEFFDQQFLDALKSALGMETTAPDSGGVGGLTPGAGLTTGWGDEKTVARSGAGRDAGINAGNPILVDSPPAGATLINNNASFGGVLYLGSDGKYYGVKK